ncbi:DUF4396 domain-containing protein [Pseudonocardia sediminis]|nr:DUF4396 domain-containing protein [Pseudonocardia sediminis]
MMTMDSNLPGWVTPVAWIYLVVAVVSAVAILGDLYLLGHRQPSRSMEVVWPVTALYLGPLAVWAYARWGRTGNSPTAQTDAVAPATTVTAGLPGGAASVLAHLVGVPLVAVTGWTIAGLGMWAMIAVIAAIALALLFFFELSSRAAASASPGTGSTVRRAGMVAVVTILAFDVGMVGWMVVLHVGTLMPPASEISFVLLMQIGVVLGLATAYPVINRLARPTTGTATS